MFHEQWKIIMDNEFMEAYLHGIVIHCTDARARRFYPRFFIYSADYPEKCVPAFDLFSVTLTYILNRILATCIRNRGLCPCPRCMTELINVHMMGTKEDLSRRMKLRTDDSHRRAKVEKSLKIIYEEGLRVDTDKVEKLLQPESWVPVHVCELATLLKIFPSEYISIECVLGTIIETWF